MIFDTPKKVVDTINNQPTKIINNLSSILGVTAKTACDLHHQLRPLLAVVWSGLWASGEQEYTCPQGRDWAVWADDKWQHEKKLTAKCNPDVKKMKNKMGKMRRKCQKCRNEKCRQNCGAVQGLSQISPWF